MRGLKISSKPFIDGHRLYYKFIKDHPGNFDGKTPSEMAEITVEDNKWFSLMRTAVKHKNAKIEGV